MDVPFYPAGRHYLIHKDEINEAIQRVLSSGKLILGYNPDIEEFENKFARFIGVKHAVMVGAGTHALYLAYRVLGIGPGDEVITTSHTYIATIDQIVALGATPVLVDIGDDGLIDPDEIEKAITPKTKAIVPVHLEGKVCDMEKINSIAWNEFDKHIFIIEDAAQAIGAVYSTWGDAVENNLGISTKAGGCSMDDRYWKAGCFSFYPAKILGSIGNTGMITTNDDELTKRLKKLRCNSNIGKNPDLNAEFGMNMEPDGIQAAVLNVRFKYLEEDIKCREEIANKYYAALSTTPLLLPYRQKGRVYQDFVIRVTGDRGLLIKFLNDHGIGILGHDLIPNHHYKALSKFKLSKTDEYISQQIRLPCRSEHTDEEINFVIKTIKDFYGK